ncbi:MAG: ABC transporter permease [Lachnospiraceae bacterium]|nr:ABC transporter permease [Lachnospiraceae bacterium]
MNNFIKSKKRELVVIVAIAIMTFIFTVLNPIYFTGKNFLSIMQQATINGILATGMTYAIISGGIDLSIGCTFAIVIVTVGKLTVTGINPFAAIILGLLLGAAMGVINGLLITKMKLQPFIATLGTMSVYRGIAYVVTGGWPVLNIPDTYRNLLSKRIPTLGGVNIYMFIFFIVAIIAGIVLAKTKFGNYIYAVGGNEEAAKLSGVNVDLTKIRAYAVTGACAAIAGMIQLASLGTGEPTAGSGYELDAIAAAAIGGTRMAGGKGTILGTVFGAILLAALKVGLIVLNVDTFWQYIVTGIIIIIAAYFEFIQEKFAGIVAKREMK